MKNPIECSEIRTETEKPKYRTVWITDGLNHTFKGRNQSCYLIPMNDTASIQLGRIVGNITFVMDYYNMATKQRK
jgi:hypothetical protein